jgi:predicted metal-dependent hydrolase
VKREIRVEDLVIEVRENLRRKRNVGFLFQPNGRLILDAPPRVDRSVLRSMVRENLRWIRLRLRKVREEARAHPPLRIHNGGHVPYLGENLVVLWVKSDAPRVHRAGKVLEVYAPSVRHVRQLVLDWYPNRASRVFGKQVERWSALPWLRTRFKSWRHQYTTAQWGSCSEDGHISLNTHLVKVPERLVEYVVLHELCHLKVHDHGPKFYSLMHHYMPDWEARRRELNDYQPILFGD